MMAELVEAIVIAANFTADPVRESLGFWMNRLGFPVDISFAPYDQVFQQLLDPSSALNRNTAGLNVLLVKLDSWAQPTASNPVPATVLERNVSELVASLTTAVERSPAPHFLLVCPPSPDAILDPAIAALLAHAEESLCTALRGNPSVHVVPTAELMAAYPVEIYYDPTSEALGQIPYSGEFFVALGTMLARRIRAVRSVPCKVLAVDCDNTLWKGVVGDLGPMGIEVDDAYRRWQEFIVAQHEAGMLLCLCSKNNEADVAEVFRTRSDMPLAWDHVTSSRINWGSKSDSLKSLAVELNLGLDSFVFVDDSPFEVAEVRANCPEVVALQLPSDAAGIIRFVDHSWAFDRLTVTAEDRARATSYRENRQRDTALKQAGSLEDFLRDLELEVDIVAPASLDFARAAQMTQRTNQFNATTIRRTEPELRRFCDDGSLECRIVRVRDRFGDYGVVGLMLYAVRAESVHVDSLLLSCRALGRRVEHRMLAELGRLAERSDRPVIDVPFLRTAKNLPALDFLNSLGTTPAPVTGDTVFRVSRELALGAPAMPLTGRPVDLPVEETGSRKAMRRDNTAVGQLLTAIATELSAPREVLAAIDAARQTTRPALQQRFVEPRTETERRVAEIWKQSLHLDAVGVQDSFFDLGGNSLIAVAMFARVRKAFGTRLSPTLLFRAATVEQLAALIAKPDIDGSGLTGASTSLVPIQATGSRRPFFCMHAGAGTVLFYQALAAALGPDQPVYALQSQGLYDGSAAHSSVEEMAAHYIAEIQTVQAQGPYRLAGFCFGATLAYEMAQQLVRMGERVSFLGSFDGVSPYFPRESGRATGQSRPVVAARVAYPIWARLLPSSVRRPIFYQYDVFRALAPLDRAPYFRAKVADRFTRRAQTARNRMLRAYMNKKGGPVPVIFRRFRWYFLVNNHLAKQRYRPVKYSGSICVFTVRGRYRSPELGWTNWMTGGVTATEIAGDFRHHRDLMNQPMVSGLAEALQPRLIGDDEAVSPATGASSAVWSPAPGSSIRRPMPVDFEPKLASPEPGAG